jgi:hypothetical protein
LLARKKGSTKERAPVPFCYLRSSECLKIRNLKTGFSAGIPCGARQNGNGTRYASHRSEILNAGFSSRFTEFPSCRTVRRTIETADPVSRNL